jgi:hypothetical protein
VTDSPSDVTVDFDGSSSVSTTAGVTEQADITISTIGDTSASGSSEEISSSITFEVTRTS